MVGGAIRGPERKIYIDTWITKEQRILGPKFFFEVFRTVVGYVFRLFVVAAKALESFSDLGLQNAKSLLDIVRRILLCIQSLRTISSAFINFTSLSALKVEFFCNSTYQYILKEKIEGSYLSGGGGI